MKISTAEYLELKKIVFDVLRQEIHNGERVDYLTHVFEEKVYERFWKPILYVKGGECEEPK